MRVSRNRRFSHLFFLTFFCALLASCSSYGPKSMDRDQLNYGMSIGDNWKNQMLANIVKLRYLDMPVFGALK